MPRLIPGAHEFLRPSRVASYRTWDQRTAARLRRLRAHLAARTSTLSIARLAASQRSSHLPRIMFFDSGITRQPILLAAALLASSACFCPRRRWPKRRLATTLPPANSSRRRSGRCWPTIATTATRPAPTAQVGFAARRSQWVADWRRARSGDRPRQRCRGVY